jgi:hypothetical protein
MGTVEVGKGRIEGNEMIAYKDAKMYGYIYSLYIIFVVPSTSHFRGLLYTFASSHEVIQPLQQLPASTSTTYKVDFFLKALMRPLVLAS